MYSAIYTTNQPIKTFLQYFIFYFKENEAFQQAMRSAEKRLLVVTRDRNYLLDRLLIHEKYDHSSSDSEETESSDDGEVIKPEQIKR